MRKIRSRPLAFATAITMALLGAGCAGNTARTGDTGMAPPDLSAAQSQKQVEPDRRARDGRINIENLSLRQLNQMGLLADVHFDFDKSNLRADAVRILRANAEFLRNYPSIRVQIEGHCDERGTPQYNLALGELRAYTSRDYIIRVGIGDSRLSTISYGEERSQDPRHNEAGWARNRRAHFRIVAK